MVPHVFDTVAASSARNLQPTTLLAIALFLCAALTSAATEDDWPSFRGPNGNGQLKTRLPAGSGDLQLSVRWRRPLGSGYSGISLGQGIAVTAASAAQRDLVMAFDPETGAERWATDLDAKTVGIAGSKDGPISTPAVGDNRVFVVSTQGRMLALDLQTGEQLWSVHLVEDLGSRRPVYGFSTSPVVVGDVVVVQTGGEAGALVGFEAETGAVRWRTVRDGHYAQSPIVTELVGRTQVVAIGTEHVVGIDPVDGKQLWSHEHAGAGGFGAESSSPVPVGRDRLFVKHDDERSIVLQVEVESDESFSVKVLSESRSMTRSYSPPTVWGSTVYGYTSRFLSALDLQSGKELWRSRSPGDGFTMAIDRHLFIVNKNDGTAHLGKASPDGWQELDQVALFEDLVWTPPSSMDGAFYVRSLTEMARVDVVRSQTTVTEREQERTLPPELDAVLRSIKQGKAASVAVDELLDELNGPFIDGERVLFFWRGEAKEVGFAGDMFGFRYDEPMTRLEGTDLWWKQLQLDRRGRYNYAFFPDYVPVLDPLNQRSTESTVMGPDLNHRGSEVLKMSWFAMPDWPGLAPTSEAVASVRTGSAEGRGGRLETFDVEIELPAPRQQRQDPSQGDSTQTVTVPVTVWLPPGYDVLPYDDETRAYPTVFSLERYSISLGGWPDTLDTLFREEVSGAGAEPRVAPLIAIMIDAPEGFYGRRGGGRVGLLVPGVLAEVDRRYRTVAKPDARAVVGALYTGPPALGLALGEDRLFSRVAVQSPFAIDATLPMHRGQMERAIAAPRPLAFYFEWARWDMRSRLEGLVLGNYMEELYEIFADAGYEMTGGEVWDSTDWSGWRNRTHLLLEAMFPADETNAGRPAGLDAWLVEP